jgi:hypothetical protein
MTRWLVVVEGDVEPRLKGPFKSDRVRVVAAQEHRGKDCQERDGLYLLDISASGSPRVHSFVSWEVSPEVDVT